ncbi:glycoside hydrolase family 32 protein [Paenibacillus donghaensis]|uniref:Levanase n=1 Tax=Paenibacillus donghaensis TaxID=414771 RepID=A0A2Z2KDL3_9BACL|nr:glycoside hydrolase family 32 protein [Paenibacillus donghaensis]ASA24816.1 levanase [Paenibacillus donghaensis]
MFTIGLAAHYSGRDHNPKEVPASHPNLTYRANYHFTAPDKWKNDPQRPIYFDGAYHYYYLYNRDYPTGNGTEWRHATSVDLVHWTDEGVAIPKYTNPNGDPWSGSVIVDETGTAGFGKGALVAIVTQPSAGSGQQEQYLWYSTDRGQTFTAYSSRPVLPNPGTPDFRDPKIIWDDFSRKWIMTLAEGTKIGFYESPNLKDWHYTSGFVTENIGLVECPDLYRMRADDGTYKWVLGVSANGKSSGKPNTYAYWTGDFDGKAFHPDLQEPLWLDYGYDWYGAVTFEDGISRDQTSHRYALAWMNNWDYAHNTPTLREGFNGMDSIVRQIELKPVGDGTYHLVSQPLEALSQMADSTVSYQQIDVNGSETLPFTGNSYELDADITWSEIKNVGLRLRESSDKNRHVDVGVSVKGGYTYVNRAYTGHPDKSEENLESTAPFDVSKKKVHLKIFVDKTSVEVFIDDGTIVYSSLIFPELNDQGITLFSEGGTAIFRNIVIKPFYKTLLTS